MSTEVSPNEPDVMPDYVDLKPPPAPPPEPKRREAAPRPAALECLHALNAEIAPAEPAAGRPKPAAEPEAAEAAEPAGVAVEADPALEAPGPVPDPGASLHREGECIPNIPDAAPEYVSAAEEKAAAAAVPPPAEPAPAAGGLLLPSWLRRSYFLVTVAVVALFGLLIFSQAVNALAMASALPVWAQYLLLIPLGLCAVALLGICAGLVHAWFRLRTVRQVDIAALDELRRREETRRDALGHYQAARTSLEEYLKKYPLEGGAVRLASAGCGAARLEELVRERNYLIGREVDSRSWLEDFRIHFQGVLDAAAAERVNSWAIKAAGCVMASPVPLLDAGLVLGISLKMIKDVAALYNARAGGLSSLVLLNRAIFAAFIAGVAEQSMEKTGEMLGQELSGALGESTLGAFGAGALKLMGPKLGEGAINALFVRRLGRAAIRMLQPLRPK